MLSNKRSRKVSRLQVGAVLAVAVFGVSAFAPQSYGAATIDANGGLNLSLTTSWNGGVLPGGTDTARFSGSFLSNTTPYNMILTAATPFWGGISFTNPSGDVNINSTANSFLTIGGLGITMGGGSSTNLNINTLMQNTGDTQWTTSATQTLNTGGSVTLGGGNLTITGPGNVVQATNNFNPWSNGNVVMNGTGTLTLTSTGNAFSTLTINNGVVLAQQAFGQTIVSGVLGGGGGAGQVSNQSNAVVNLNTGGTLNLQMSGTQLYNQINVNGVGTVNHLTFDPQGFALASGTSFGGAFVGTNAVLNYNLLSTAGAANDQLGAANGAFSAFSGTLNLSTAGNTQLRIGGNSDPLMNNVVVNLLGTNGITLANNSVNGVFTIGTLQTTNTNAVFQGASTANVVTNYNIGAQNTNATWAGQIANGTTAPIITKVGTGTWTLTNINAGGFSGQYVAAGGVLEVSRLTNNLLTLGSFNNATVTLRYFGATANGLPITSSGAVALSGNNASLEYAGTGGGLTITSTAIVAQTADTTNTFTPASVTSRTLTLGGNSTTGISTFSNNLQNMGTFNTLAGVATINNALVKNGATTWILTGTVSTYSLGTTVNAGNLFINSTGNSIGTGAIVVNSTGGFGGNGTVTLATGNKVTFNSGSSLNTGVPGAVNGFGTVTLGGATSAIIATGVAVNMDLGVLPIVTGDAFKLTTGSLSLSGVAGGNTLTLSNGLSGLSFPYNGVFNLMNFSNTSNFFDGVNHPAAGAAINDFVIANPFFNSNPGFGANATYTFKVNAAGNAVAVQISGGLAFSNWVGASGSWGTGANWSDLIPYGTLSGTGDVALFGTGSTGAVAVNLGIGRVLGGIGFDNSTANTVSYTLNGADLTMDNTVEGINAQIAMSNVIQSHTIATPHMALNTNTTITTFNTGSTLTISAQITGAAGKGIIVTGPGRVVLTNTATDTYSGSLTINTGATVQVGTNNASGALTSGSIVNNSGTLIYNRNDATTLNFNTVGNGTFNLASGTLSLAAGAGSFGNNTILSLASGSMFNLNGRASTVGTIRDASTAGPFSTITNLGGGLATLTLNPATGVSTTFSGLITDAGGGNALTLAMGGTTAGNAVPGSITLTGANTYSGPTIFNLNTSIQAGTTPVGTPGAIVVANNQALSTGLIIVKGIGSISVGNTDKGLILANNISLANNIQFQVSGQSTGLSGFTTVVAGGSATLAGNISNNGSDVGGDVALNALMRIATGFSNSTLTLLGLVDSTDPGGSSGTGIALNDGNFIIGPAGSLTANTTPGFANSFGGVYLGSTFGSTTSNVTTVTFLGNSGVNANRNFFNTAVTIGGSSLTLTTVNLRNNSVINAGPSLVDLAGVTNAGFQTALNMFDSSKIIAGGFRKTTDGANAVFTIDGGTIQSTFDYDSFMLGSNFSKIILRPGGLTFDIGTGGFGAAHMDGWAQGISGNIVNTINASFENNTTTNSTVVAPSNWTVNNRQLGVTTSVGTQAIAPSGATNTSDGKQAMFITGAGTNVLQNIGNLATGTTYTLTVSMLSRGVNNAFGAATGFMSVVDANNAGNGAANNDIGTIIASSGPINLVPNTFNDYSITFTTGTTSTGNFALVLSQVTPNSVAGNTTSQVQLLADNVRLTNAVSDGGWKMLGNGTLTLYAGDTDVNSPNFGISGPSTYNGLTDIGSVNVVLAGSNATSRNSIFRVAGTGNLTANAGNFFTLVPGNTIGGLDGNGSTTGFVHGGGLLTMNVVGTNAVYGGTLGGGEFLSIGKSGNGTQTLSGVINYLGTTVAGGGMLNYASNNAIETANGFAIGAGDSVVRSTFNGTSSTLSFSGIVGNNASTGSVVFETSGGASGTTNRILFNSNASSIISPDAFFRTDPTAASDYAYANGSGVLKAVPWGTTGFAQGPTIANGNTYNKAVGAVTSGTVSTIGLNVASGAVVTVSGTLSFSGGSILKTGGGTGTIAGGSIAVGLGGPSEFLIRTDSTADTLSITSTIIGNNIGLVKTGPGVLQLGASNSYSGPTTILSGAIDVVDLNGLANTTVNYMSTGGSLNFTSLFVNMGGLNGDRSLGLASGTLLRIGGNGASSAFSGGFVGAGEFHKKGTGLFQLYSPTASYTGNVFLDLGSLALDNSNAMTGGSLVMSSGTTLYYGAANLPFSNTSAILVNGTTGSSVAITRVSGGTTDSFSGLWSSPTTQTMTMSLPTASTLLFNGTGNQFAAFTGKMNFGASPGTMRLGGVLAGAGQDVAMGGTAIDMGTGGMTIASNAGGTQSIGSLTSVATTSILTGILNTATTGSSTPLTNYAVGALNTNTTYAGNITNTNTVSAFTALTKVGTGTLTLGTLSGLTSRSYSGGTNVNGGRLVALANATNGTFSLLGTGSVTLGAPTAVLQFSSSTASSTHTVSNIGGVGGTINNATVGTVIVDANNLVNGNMIRAGSLTLNGSLTLGNNSAVSALQSLSLAHTGVGSTAVYTSTLQLNNNRMVLQTADSTSKAAAILSINEALFSGKGTAGTWTGTKGITSSSAAGNTAQLTVAVYDNANLRDLVNTANPRTNWAGGIGNVDANSLLVTTALKGDVNLDGIVNVSDLILIAAHFNEFGQSNGISTLDMSHGDVNQDGIVNVSDLILTAGNFNSTSNFNLATSMIADAQAGDLGALSGFSLTPAQVPEPASVALLALGSAALLTRRRSKK